jgi:hypothetical protein
MRIYCDSVILIYFLEGNPAFKARSTARLAAAAEAGCDRFLTNDSRLSRCTDIAVEVLP